MTTFSSTWASEKEDRNVNRENPCCQAKGGTSTKGSYTHCQKIHSCYITCLLQFFLFLSPEPEPVFVFTTCCLYGFHLNLSDVVKWCLYHDTWRHISGFIFIVLLSCRAIWVLDRPFNILEVSYQCIQEWEAASKALKDEEANKQKLCEDLNNLVVV